MQLPAEQTSLELHPHRAAGTGRRPFVNQSTPDEATAADSRASPPCLTSEHLRSPDSQEDLNKLPNLAYDAWHRFMCGCHAEPRYGREVTLWTFLGHKSIVAVLT